MSRSWLQEARLRLKGRTQLFESILNENEMGKLDESMFMDTDFTNIAKNVLKLTSRGVSAVHACEMIADKMHLKLALVRACWEKARFSKDYHSLASVYE